MAIIKWMSGFNKDRFKEFTSVRKYFEEFLIFNARAVGETISTRGSRGRSVPTLISYYDLLLNELAQGSNVKTIIKKMRKQPKLFPFAAKFPDVTEYGAEFSTETKSAVFLIDALRGAPICRVCHARYQPDSVNADHKIPMSQGGMGYPKNLSPTHYYCNSGKTTLEPIIQAAWQRFEASRAPTRKPRVHQPP
jgi:hypothetical protein